MNDNILILTEFPLLVPQNSNLSAFAGFITISGIDYGLKVSVPQSSVSTWKFSCDIKLRNLIQGSEGIITQRLLHAKNLYSFLKELKTFAENLSSCAPHIERCSRPSEFFKILIEHIENLGWDKVVEIDSTFMRLKLEAVDSMGTTHTLSLTMPPDYNKTAPICHCNLPTAFELSWQEYRSTLTSIYYQFKNVLQAYQDFWFIMGELDKNTWIIDQCSVTSTSSSVSRRIVVGDNTSMMIKVDPRNPRMFPEIRFLGADKSIQPIRQTLNNNVNLWDNQRTLLENLISILKIDFPQKATVNQPDNSTRDCGICYSYQLSDAVPGKACDDNRCGQVYHQECLYEWLRSLTTSRQSFDQLFGECPYCTRPITVDVKPGKDSNKIT